MNERSVLIENDEEAESSIDNADGLPVEPDDMADVPVAATPARRESVWTRNFLLVALFQIILRTGWIFKTESIIIPAFMDLIGGTPAMRGCLPALNRLGQSIPPLLLARRVKLTKQKRRGLIICSLIMGGCFLALALMWIGAGGISRTWMPWLFLAIYAVFFASVGMNNLYMNTLQGKLVPASGRGRLMLFANIVGSVFAIGFAFWLLPLWLEEDGGRFGLIFGFSGVCFVLAIVSLLFISEADDNFEEAPVSVVQLLRQTKDALRQDVALKRVILAAAGFGSTIMLFPHYQALARTSLQLDFSYLMIWVVVQNAGTATFSLFTGLVADKLGNRLALRWSLLFSSVAPLLALLLAAIGPQAASWFSAVFVLVGLTPVTIRLFTNYALELAHAADHAKYVSILGLCISAPILVGSPIVGWLVGQLGFTPIFLTSAVVSLVSCVMTFFIEEPRDRPSND